MLEYIRFVVYPLIGTFLGFITNFIAIKLLFRPRKKIFGIQGLLPKRKMEIAKKAGEIVNEYLVNSNDIRKELDRNTLERAVDNYLSKNKSPLWDIPIMRKMAKNIIVTFLIDNDGYFSRKVIESIIHNEMVSNIVKKKIEDFDISQLESLVKKASGREINFIIITGAILGFLIGLIEALIRF